MVSPIRPLQQRALGAQVADDLRELIVRRELERGTHLVEDRLAVDFGVSRGPIRDSLRQLEKEGLVESRRRGIFVVGIDNDDINDLYSLRSAIEVVAATHAMDRATDTELSTLEVTISEMRKAADTSDHKSFADADLRFHASLYRLSKHRWLSDIWQQYQSLLSTLLQVTVDEDADLHPSAEDHQLLLDLLRAGDKEAVTTALLEHLDGARERMQRAYATPMDDVAR